MIWTHKTHPRPQSVCCLSEKKWLLYNGTALHLEASLSPSYACRHLPHTSFSYQWTESTKAEKISTKRYMSDHDIIIKMLKKILSVMFYWGAKWRCGQFIFFNHKLVTIKSFINFSIRDIAAFAEVSLTSVESHSYLTGVSAAAVIPVKYECDTWQVNNVLTILKMEKVRGNQDNNPHWDLHIESFPWKHWNYTICCTQNLC